MENEKSIELLNSLIEINNDRMEGYDTASKETEEVDLKVLFSEFKEVSRLCKEELGSEVRKLGGEPTEGTKTTGKLFRIWMDVKAAFTGKDRKNILNSCEYGEDAAVNTYKDVLKNNVEKLTAEQHKMVNEQFKLIKADHNKIRGLRDLMLNHL